MERSELPNGWKTVKLGEVGGISSGGTPDTNNKNYWNGDIFWITPTEITKLENRFIYSTERKITKEGLKNSSAKLLPINSVIVCTRATIGEIGINKVELATNQGFKNIFVNKDNSVDYVYFLLKQNKHKLIEKASGSTFLEISKSEFENLELPLPPLAEQTRIAGCLSKWDDGIEKLKKLIAAKKKLKKGLMQMLLSPKGDTSPLAGEVNQRSGEGHGNNNPSHRHYAPYIKEFARQMRHEMTKAELLIWNKVRNNGLGVKFRRQFAIDSKYIADFVCLEKRLIVEIDGGQHCESAKDDVRTFYLEKEDFRVIRFWNGEVLENLEGCIELLLDELKNPSPVSKAADLSRRGRGVPLFLKGVEWKVVKLGEVCNVIMGQSPSSLNYNSDRIGLPLIQGNADISNSKTISRIYTKEITKISKKGYIILTVRAPVGEIAYVIQDEVCIGRGVSSINGINAINEFIFFYLIHNAKKWQELEQGSTFSAINRDDIENLEIHLPPLPIQQRIAAILSKADEEIALLGKKLTNLQLQKNGLMQVLLSGKIRFKEFKTSPPAGEVDQRSGEGLKHNNNLN